MRSTRGDTAAPAGRRADAAPTPLRRLLLALFMTGIQYSTAPHRRNRLGGRPCLVAHSRKAAVPSPKHPLGTAAAVAKPQSPARKNRRGCEPVHRAAAGEGPGLRGDTEGESLAHL